MVKVIVWWQESPGKHLLGDRVQLAFLSTHTYNHQHTFKQYQSMQTGFAVVGVLVFSAPCFVSGLCYFSNTKGWSKGQDPDQIYYSAAHPGPQGLIKEGMGLTTNHWESLSWIFQIRTGERKPLFQGHRAGRMSIWRCQLPLAPMPGESLLAVGEKKAKTQLEELALSPHVLSVYCPAGD